jgi:hypothetical protein
MDTKKPLSKCLKAALTGNGRYKIRTCDPFRVKEVNISCMVRGQRLLLKTCDRDTRLMLNRAGVTVQSYTVTPENVFSSLVFIVVKTDRVGDFQGNHGQQVGLLSHAEVDERG